MPRPEKRPGRLSALALWAFAALGLILSALAAGFLAPKMNGMRPQMQLLLTDVLYYLPFVALPVFLLARRNPGLAEAYRPGPISLFNVISIVVLALLGVFLANDITVLWSIPFQKLGLSIYTTALPTPANTRDLALSVITVAAIPAVCEEFLFRGAVMPAFEKHGTRHAILCTSLLFALLHGSIIGLPSQFILGVILCLLVFWTNSVYAGLIYHTVHNSAAVILDYVQNQTPEAAAISDDLYTAIGGMSGVLDLALSVLLSAAMVLLTLKLFRMRGQLRGITMEARKKEKLRRGEIIALVCGLILCAVLYASDIISMLGGSAL